MLIGTCLLFWLFFQNYARLKLHNNVSGTAILHRQSYVGKAAAHNEEYSI